MANHSSILAWKITWTEEPGGLQSISRKVLGRAEQQTLVTFQQNYAQNPSSQASTVHGPRTSRCTSWIQKRQRNKRSNCNIHWITEKAREFQKSSYFCFIDYAKAFDYVDHNKLWKSFKETGIPDHLTCLLRNLYTGQEATVRTGHGTMGGSKLGKEYVQPVYYHPAYLTSVESTTCEMLGWVKHR